jgi:hypothetical protein
MPKTSESKIAKQAAAPGLVWRVRKSGQRVPYWAAPAKAVAAGYEPKTVRLNGAMTADQLAAACRRCQLELAEWLGGKRGQRRARNDGTVAALIRAYETDPTSRFCIPQETGGIKWNTKTNYQQLNEQLYRAVGGKLIANLTRQDMHHWYLSFRDDANGKPMLAKAKACMEQFSRLLLYGVSAEIEGCERLYKIINGVGGKGSPKPMPFKGADRRTAQLTFDHVAKFCEVAHGRGHHKIALATVLQFESLARQADVIGQWGPAAPNALDGPMVTTGRRWTGLTWGAHISPVDLVMQKPTSKSREKKKAMADLSLSAFAMAELMRVPPDQRIGPVIVSEYTGLPYQRKAFNRLWRQLANLAGIPKEVQNRDARAGGITEAYEAEAVPDHIRSAATHGDMAINQSYDRQTMLKAVSVQQARLAYRASKPK